MKVVLFYIIVLSPFILYNANVGSSYFLGSLFISLSLYAYFLFFKHKISKQLIYAAFIYSAIPTFCLLLFFPFSLQPSLNGLISILLIPLLMIASLGFLDIAVGIASELSFASFILFSSLVLIQLVYSNLFFTEPSHFAIFSCFPLIILTCSAYIYRKQRFTYFISLCLSLLLILRQPNLTFFVVLLTCAILLLVLSQKHLLLICLTLFSVFSISLLPKYFLARLDISSNSDTLSNNISNIAYYQGLLYPIHVFKSASIFGLGAGNMGRINDSFLSSPVVRHMQYLAGGNDVGITDGTFVFSKVVTEFGVIGLVLTLILLLISLKFIRNALIVLRHLHNCCISTSEFNLYFTLSSLLLAFTASYLVQLFIRGFGYLNFFLMYISAASLLNYRLTTAFSCIIKHKRSR